MLAVGGALRVLLLTRHTSLRQALDSITTEGAVDHLVLLRETLVRLGVVNPRIALAAFNPHAGEGGLFGSEDDAILTPAVREARRLGVDASGPLPADSLFGRAARGEFDGVLALYHDQGLIPVKTVAFDTAVTVIAGSPHLRVSVIHGAGFDRAGKNAASPANMLEAIRRAAEWAGPWRARA
jgi:4-hydroxythreonine-4-phosphate dehydrogenase